MDTTVVIAAFLLILFVLWLCHDLLSRWLSHKTCVHKWIKKSVTISNPVGDFKGQLSSDTIRKLMQGEVSTTYSCVKCGKLETVSVIGKPTVIQQKDFVEPASGPTWTCKTTTTEYE